MFLLLLAALCNTIHTLTDDNFDKAAQGNWVVVFEASWCPYCQRFKPIVKELREKISKYEIGTVDIEKESALNSRFLIQKLPSVFIIKDGTTREIAPSFNIDELMHTIETVDKVPPLLIQPFGYIGLVLFYLGMCGKVVLSGVKVLQNYFPTWMIIILAALSFIVTIGALLYVTAPAPKVDKKKTQ